MKQRRPCFCGRKKRSALSLGDGVYALRLPAFLASCAALPLLAWAAGRLLEPRGRAVGRLPLRRVRTAFVARLRGQTVRLRRADRDHPDRAIRGGR